MHVKNTNIKVTFIHQKQISWTITIFCCLILIFAAKLINSQNILPIIKTEKQFSATNVHSNLLYFSSLGNPRLVSSLLWVQTLLESDLKHYKNKDLNSWMYLRFNSITDLDPYFYEAYLFGGQYLSVVKDDIHGAAQLYKKGLSKYPSDYNLNFYAAFNYYFELNNPNQAFIHYDRIVEHPKMPKYLPSLIAKLRAKNGDLKPALALIQDAYNNAPQGSRVKKHFFKSLYKIKTQYDLYCLNTIKVNCSTKDLLGNKYTINKKGTYQMPLNML